jgi:hypothetical protein
MLKPKIKVGHYYELKLGEEHTIAFAVLYGFERGKNKDVYTFLYRFFFTSDKNLLSKITKSIWKSHVHGVG